MPRPDRATRESIALACSVCSARNYKTTKARRESSAPLILSKYCKTCNRHTEHREGK